MNCNICNGFIPDGSSSCPICGAYVQAMPAQVQPMQQGMPQPSQVQPMQQGMPQPAQVQPMQQGMPQPAQVQPMQQGMIQPAQVQPTFNEEFRLQPVDGDNSSASSKKVGIVSPGLIICILSAILLTVGMFLPAIDFTAFHKDVDLQYNMLKVCKNIALISSMWRAIPIGFFISAAALLILGFVKVPVFRVLPVILAIAMFVLILVDMGNVIDWVTDVCSNLLKTDMAIDAATVIKSFMAGIYVMVAGLVLGIVSIFVK